MKDRILETACNKFFQLGFSRVTVEEIARELGISKKTLYEHFASKEELLREILLRMTGEIEIQIDAILQDKHADFVEKLRQVWAFLASRLSRMGPIFRADLQRHAPSLWREVDERRDRIIHTRFRKLFQKGVEHRAFRKEVDPQLLLLIYSTLIQRIINPETLSQLPFSASQAFEAIATVIFEGILTDRARGKLRARCATL